MAILNYTKNRMTLLLGGSIINSTNDNFPTYFMIGTGSSTVAVTQDSLGSAVDRQLFTTKSYPTSQSLKFQGDWNSTELSGLSIQEFGICASGTDLTGSMWSRNIFEGVTFDGTSEMRILETWQVI